MSIGANLKRLRTDRAMSQTELAERVHVTQSMIAQIERATKAMSLPLGMEIADALECDVQEFTKGIP